MTQKKREFATEREKEDWLITNHMKNLEYSEKRKEWLERNPPLKAK